MSRDPAPLGGPLLAVDLALLPQLRAAGLLVGLRPLDALVAIRRARRYGEGGARLRGALEAMEAAPRGASPEGTACPDCRGRAWRYGRDGGPFCGNCGYVPERKSS